MRKIAREQAKPETIHLQSYKGLWEVGADRNQYQYYCHEQGKWIRIKRSHYGLCVRVRYAGIYDSTSHHTGFYYIWSNLSAENHFIKEENISTERYLSCFFPFDKYVNTAARHLPPQDQTWNSAPHNVRTSTMYIRAGRKNNIPTQEV